jgi:hypothetical protein
VAAASARTEPRFGLHRIVASGAFGTVHEAAMELPGGSRPVALRVVHPEQHEQRGALGPALIAEFFGDLAETLACAHEHRDGDGRPLLLVHRDIKPSNLMLARDGSAKLLDFGVARAEDRIQAKTKTGHLRGTSFYMSPEQVAGELELDARWDLFALGSVLFEAITDHRLMKPGNVIQVLRQVSTFEPSAAIAEVEDRCPELAPIVARCLQPDRDRRYGSARGLAEALSRHRVPRGRARLAAGLQALFADETPRETRGGDTRLGMVHTVRSVVLAAPRQADAAEPAAPELPRWIWPAALAGTLALAAVVAAVVRALGSRLSEAWRGSPGPRRWSRGCGRGSPCAASA